MRTAVVRKDERRAEKLRQVGRRIKNGSSMVAQMTPVKRVALVRRHYRRRRPMREQESQHLDLYRGAALRRARAESGPAGGVPARLRSRGGPVSVRP
jgi:hypothetical protein